MNEELAICFHINHCGATATRPCVARNFAEAVKARRQVTAAQEVSTWAKKARDAASRRDAAIHRMRDEGSTLRSIAEAAGLTHTAVAKILARQPRP
jgi:hypothetical protein